MWTVSRSTGWLTDAHGVMIARASFGDPDNPIPMGRWRFVGPPVTTDDHGPFVIAIEPAPGTDSEGRNGFMLRGNAEEPGSGAIIAPRAARGMVWQSGDRELKVIE